MPRKSNTIPDTPPGKQLEHYVNGKDNADGMHPGIRSKCEICKEIDSLLQKIRGEKNA